MVQAHPEAPKPREISAFSFLRAFTKVFSLTLSFTPAMLTVNVRSKSLAALNKFHAILKRLKKSPVNQRFTGLFFFSHFKFVAKFKRPSTIRIGLVQFKKLVFKMRYLLILFQYFVIFLRFYGLKYIFLALLQSALCKCGVFLAHYLSFICSYF